MPPGKSSKSYLSVIVPNAYIVVSKGLSLTT
jgi:hypothetical protein